jgi:tRNA (cmo5U34)-methyltransferase
VQYREKERDHWFNDAYVEKWLGGQPDRSGERTRQFAIVRSVIPHLPDESFRIMDVGGGDGWLVATLLDHFTNARGLVVDGSSTMVEHAQERLAKFGDRASVVQADLDTPDWANAVDGPIDVAVSSIAIHNLGDASRIRNLYAEIFGLLSDGGCFFNLDYVRAPSPAIRTMGRWAARDQEAGYVRPHSTGGGSAGTINEQLGWLHEAGFVGVDAYWKEFQAVLFGGFKGSVRIPDPENSEATAAR